MHFLSRRGADAATGELAAVVAGGGRSPESVEAHVLWALIIGLIVGAVAKFLMPGKDPGGFIITMLIGIAGSLIATFLGRALGMYRTGESAGFIMSVLGAVLLLWIYRMTVARRARL
jgi:uncharacterized membrane protein YeaQ/YmgE (transglycosylase-associated protein family)